MLPTTAIEATPEVGNSLAEGQQMLPSQTGSSASSIFANADEDWRTSRNFEERRRIQSRIAQRQYRQKQKQIKIQKPSGEARKMTQSGPITTETVQEDFPTVDLFHDDAHQQLPYILNDQIIPGAHQQFLPSDSELTMSQPDSFLSQLPNSQFSSSIPETPIATTSSIDLDGQPQPMYNLSNLFIPLTTESEYSQALRDISMPSQQSIPFLTSPWPSYTWNCKTTPDMQVSSQQWPKCCAHSSHHRPVRPQSHHCRQHKHDYVIYAQQYPHRDSKAPPSCGCSSLYVCYQPPSHYDIPQRLVPGNHELDMAWIEPGDSAQSPCAYSSCCHHRNEPMTSCPISAFSQWYRHTPSSLQDEQTCCDGQQFVYVTDLGHPMLQYGLENYGPHWYHFVAQHSR